MDQFFLQMFLDMMGRSQGKVNGRLNTDFGCGTLFFTINLHPFMQAGFQSLSL